MYCFRRNIPTYLSTLQINQPKYSNTGNSTQRFHQKAISLYQLHTDLIPNMFVLQNASVLYFESLRMIFPQKSCSSLDGFLILFEIFQSCMKNYFQFILDQRQKTVNLLTNLLIKSSLISYPRFLSASISTFPFLDIKNIKMKRGFGTKQVQSKIILYIYYISQFY